MILDSIQNFKNYLSLHPLFPAVADFIFGTDLNALPNGTVDILPDKKVYANVMDCDLKDVAIAQPEFHRDYIDVQIVIAKSEEMGWLPLPESAASADFNTEKDIAFLPDRPVSMVSVPAGFFVVFMPTDAHAPCCGGPGKVRKIVVKVRC